MKRFLLACLVLLLLFIILLSGCNITKRISKSKESIKTEESTESTGSKRTQLTQDWSMINSSLFHRNGQLWIEFDSIAQIDLTPRGLTAIGYNPIIHGQISETTKDTTVINSSIQLDQKQDSTSRTQKKSVVDRENNELDKTQKTQNIGRIIVLVIILIILLLCVAIKFKLF